MLGLLQVQGQGEKVLCLDCPGCGVIPCLWQLQANKPTNKTSLYLSHLEKSLPEVRMAGVRVTAMTSLSAPPASVLELGGKKGDQPQANCHHPFSCFEHEQPGSQTLLNLEHGVHGVSSDLAQGPTGVGYLCLSQVVPYHQVLQGQHLV